MNGLIVVAGITITKVLAALLLMTPYKKSNMHRVEALISGIIGAVFSGMIILIGYFWMVNNQRTSSDFNYPVIKERLLIKCINNFSRPIEAAILLDDRSVMNVKLPGKYWFGNEYGVVSGFSPLDGKHEIALYIDGYGIIAKRDIIQENAKTNFVTIAINEPEKGSKQLGGLIILRTVNGGGNM